MIYNLPRFKYSARHPTYNIPGKKTAAIYSLISVCLFCFCFCLFFVVLFFLIFLSVYFLDFCVGFCVAVF